VRAATAEAVGAVVRVATAKVAVAVLVVKVELDSCSQTLHRNRCGECQNIPRAANSKSFRSGNLVRKPRALCAQTPRTERRCRTQRSTRSSCRRTPLRWRCST
jgi:hypothetical protein